MLKNFAISFSDWNAERLHRKAARILARSKWWTDFAEWIETGEWTND